MHKDGNASHPLHTPNNPCARSLNVVDSMMFFLRGKGLVATMAASHNGCPIFCPCGECQRFQDERKIDEQKQEIQASQSRVCLQNLEPTTYSPGSSK